MKNRPLIGIIGGKGKMGNWFKIFFEKQGLKVIISDKKTKLSNIDLAKMADIVIISVPIDITVKTIEEIRDFVKKETLLTDFTSLKVEPVKAMAKADCGILGMHPLFGPFETDLKEHNIVFCLNKKNKWINFLEKTFKENGANIVKISSEEHDKQMAFLQALIHFSNITIAHFFNYKKFQPLPQFFTPLFKLQSLVFGRILAQNPKLYADIALENPYFKKLIKEYVKELINFQKIIEQKNSKEFQKKFKDASRSLSNFVKVAENKTNEILKLLEKQPIKITKIKKIAIKNARVGFLGPEGTFSWTAAKEITPINTSLKPFSTIREVFEGINNFEVDYGIVPFQNTIGGLVSETIHSFTDFPLYTLGSFKIPIHHCLLSRKKRIKDVKIIKSHAQALSQCQFWLTTNLPHTQKIATSSTISSVDEKGDIGFIAPEQAAKIFNLNILARNIEDTKANITRFLFIAKEFDKNLIKKIKIETKNTFLLLSIYDRVGVLKDILSVFANKNINLSALHSIPSRSHPWDYLFFLEIEKSLSSPDLKLILNQLNEYCPFIRIIGSG